MASKVTTLLLPLENTYNEYTAHWTLRGALGKLFIDYYGIIYSCYLLPYFMEQNPSSEANLFSDNQEIPRILW